MNWSAPRIWPGSTVYILGGGPSLLNNDLTLIHKERCIGVNNSVFLGDWVDICWFGDVKWWNWHKARLRDYKGLIVTCNMKMRKWKRMKTLSRGKPQGIDERATHVSWNRNSGASAINLAYHFGASRVVLLGFDMQRVNDKKNWHDDHKEKRHDPFPRHLRPFGQIARDAMSLDLEIINATPGSAIKQFPIMSLNNLINEGGISKVIKREESRDRSVIRKTSTMEKPREIGKNVFIGHFNVFRANIKIGSRTKIGHHCVFEGDIVIGEDCLIQPQCNITAGTIIEDKVFIGQGVITGNDKRMVHLRRDKVPFEQEPPIFRSGCRIGMGSVILPGVVIGTQCFIAAGSVVTKDTEPFSLYKGNPARKVGMIPDEERLS